MGTSSTSSTSSGAAPRIQADQVTNLCGSVRSTALLIASHLLRRLFLYAQRCDVVRTWCLPGAELCGREKKAEKRNGPAWCL